jgi:ABC-type amino acid transport substrate-binding protein
MKIQTSYPGVWWQLFLVLQAVAVALMTNAKAAEGTLDKILSEKKVNICWVSSPPQEMKDPKTGEVTGYFVDAARFMFGQLKVEPMFIETTWANFVATLQSGQADFCIASSFASIKRAAVVDFTRPILYLGRSAIVRKDDNRFKSLADLNSDKITIAVLTGSRSQEFVTTNLPNAKVLSLAGSDPSAPFLAVTAGRADAGINDAWAARRFAQNQPMVKDLFGNEPFNVSPMAWTVKKGNTDLLNFLNTSLEVMLASGDLEKMAKKYPNAGRYRRTIQLVPFATE